MKEVKEIAYLLSKGSVEKAAELRMSVTFDDKELELEVVEIVRQALFSYFKKGEIKKAENTQRLFKIPTESIDDALKQAVLSNYRDGNFKSMIQIRNNIPMSRSLRAEIVEYCESWKSHQKEAEAMKKVFLD